MDEKKIAFIKQHALIIENSLHLKSLARVFTKKYIEITIPIAHLIRFSIIFEPQSISRPRQLIEILLKYKFYHFILSPEVYALWNNQNLSLLENELNILAEYAQKNPNIIFHGPDADSLPIKKNDCHKVIADEHGDTFACNRIDRIPQDFTYDSAFDFFDAIN